jgi:hypothetical protein
LWALAAALFVISSRLNGLVNTDWTPKNVKCVTVLRSRYSYSKVSECLSRVMTQIWSFGWRISKMPYLPTTRLPMSKQTSLCDSKHSHLTSPTLTHTHKHSSHVYVNTHCGSHAGLCPGGPATCTWTRWIRATTPLIRCWDVLGRTAEHLTSKASLTATFLVVHTHTP